MDITTLGGLVIALGAVASSFLMEGGDPQAVVLFSPILLVVGGSFGAAALGSSATVARSVPTYLRIAFSGRRESLKLIIEDIVGMAERSRREGVLSLEKDIDFIKDRFFAKAIQLVVDGIEVSALREVLQNEMSCIAVRHQRGIDFFNRLGGFSPTLGILGTVLALVHTLGQLDNPDNIAGSIAGAFVATLWGVGMANLVYLPIADKLKSRHEEEIVRLEMITEGVSAIQNGDNPRLIRTRLQAFLSPDDRRAGF